MTSLSYADGRLYYTLNGQTALYTRTFSPDSGIVGANRSTVPGITLRKSRERSRRAGSSTT